MTDKQHDPTPDPTGTWVPIHLPVPYCIYPEYARRMGTLVCLNCQTEKYRHYQRPPMSLAAILAPDMQQGSQDARTQRMLQAQADIARAADDRAARRKSAINPDTRGRLTDAIIITVTFALLVGAWLALAAWQHGGSIVGGAK